MNKVYVIHSFLEEYVIEEVFTRKEKAQQYLDLLVDYREIFNTEKEKEDFKLYQFEIEERELDLLIDKIQQGLNYYVVYMNRSGKVEDISNETYRNGADGYEDYIVKIKPYEETALINSCWAENKIAAINKTDELRKQLIEEKQLFKAFPE